MGGVVEAVEEEGPEAVVLIPLEEGLVLLEDPAEGAELSAGVMGVTCTGFCCPQAVNTNNEVKNVMFNFILFSLGTRFMRR